MDNLIMEKDHMEKLYASRNPFVRFVCDKRLEEIVGLIPQGKNLKILDAGCGEGQLLLKIARLRGGELYGADITEVALESAKERVAGAHFSLQDLGNLKYEDNFFDVVVCTEVIEHISRYRETIAQLKRVLKKGGLLILTFPNEPVAIFCRAVFFRRPTIADHVNWFFPRKMMRAVGLELARKINIPFHLPDFLTIIHLLAFRK